MSVLVPMVVFSQFVDVLVAQGFVHVVAVGAQRAMLHALLLFVSLWTVVWAVSLRSAMRHVDHLLGAHALTLAIGFKHVCRLPLAAIADVRAIDREAARNGRDWFDVHGLTPHDVTRLQALDAPTLLIALKTDAAGAWGRAQRRAPAAEALDRGLRRPTGRDGGGRRRHAGPVMQCASRRGVTLGNAD